MSGFLNRIGKRKIAFAAVLALGLLCMLVRLYAFGTLMLAALLLNEGVMRRIRMQRAPFEPRSRVRNIDYLLIGDMCRPSDVVPAGKSYVQIAAPGRSLAASFEILRHTHSILKEDGGYVVLSVRHENAPKRAYTVFDVPFFHEVTMDRLHLKTLFRLRAIPALVSPWRSVCMLLNVHPGSWMPTQCPWGEVADFCSERGLQFVYMKLCSNGR